MKQLRIGLVLNPLAGIGGPTALKGSDNVADEAFARGAVSQVENRVRTVLHALRPYRQAIAIYTVPGVMGGNLCREIGWEVETIDVVVPKKTDATITKESVKKLQKIGLDLLVFAGGDGTAKDIYDTLENNQTILGIPCGVKMHSSVFANNPDSAARIILAMANDELLGLMRGEIRDIDEADLRKGIVNSQYYGECWVPEEFSRMQATKAGGQIDELVIEDIAAGFIEQMEDDCYYLIGSGSTVAAVMGQLGLQNTLLGVDVICNEQLVFSDADEKQLHHLISSPETKQCKILITVIGGQGHIFGRGNQQLSPRVLWDIGLENIIIIADEGKLNDVKNVLVVDTGDLTLDQKLCGYRRVISGYETSVLCRVVC